ncbi:putative Ring finger domain/Zn-finger in ubiquitin-hydrolase [Trypanosoma cruzi]|nr:putative Ring finger domain/Zn-finger in ubiquitin-hydrolase [Trypanosoma cruzi]
MSNVDVSVLVLFDKEKVAVVELFYERVKPTRWLLVRSIPIDVTLLQALQCLNLCVSVCSSTTRGGRGDGACGSSGPGSRSADGCIGVVRVGCTPEEEQNYCLLLQFDTARDAKRVKNKLLHANLTGSSPTSSEHVCGMAKVKSSYIETDAGYDGVGIEGKQHGGLEEENIDLEELCSVMHGGAASASTHLQGGCPGSMAWRNLEQQGGSHLAHSVLLTPMEDFCSICQEIASSKPFIVTLCKHVFHLSCFSKHLEDVGQSCPLCRFSMASLKSKCYTCGSCSDLWTCLVCGWVACGRGHRHDALHHFESTGHSCAMQNSTSRIWNYRAKDFLHHQLAIELGDEDDVKALKAAAEDAPTNSRFNKGETGVTASSYRRSRWWWDKEEEEAALDLNAEHVHEYYLGVMQQLMKEQSEYFEGRGETGVIKGGPGGVAPTVTTAEATSEPSTAMLRKLVTAEQRQRRRIFSEYMSGMRRAALREKISFYRLVKLEAVRNENLHEELFLQSQVIQSLHTHIEQTRRRIDEASRRGMEQLALKRATLESLQEKLDLLLKSMD